MSMCQWKYDEPLNSERLKTLQLIETSLRQKKQLFWETFSCTWNTLNEYGRSNPWAELFIDGIELEIFICVEVIAFLNYDFCHFKWIDSIDDLENLKRKPHYF